MGAPLNVILILQTQSTGSSLSKWLDRPTICKQYKINGKKKS